MKKKKPPAPSAITDKASDTGFGAILDQWERGGGWAETQSARDREERARPDAKGAPAKRAASGTDQASSDREAGRPKEKRGVPGTAGSKKAERLDFGAILDQWEHGGGRTKAQPAQTARARSDAEAAASAASKGASRQGGSSRNLDPPQTAAKISAKADKVANKTDKASDKAEAKEDEAAWAAWVASHPVSNKDLECEEEETPAERRQRLLASDADAKIDLHMMTCQEALEVLQDFFEEGWRRGAEKLLVIHGKGSHSAGGEAALRDLTEAFLERCPYAGESGRGAAREGGSGVTWVLLKDKRKTRTPP